MQQTGFWANVSLIAASLILLLAWSQLPLFSTPQADVIARLHDPQSGPPPSQMALDGTTLIAHLTLFDSPHRANGGLFQLAWLLVILAGIGGLVCGGIALWWPAWSLQAAFGGVVCGVMTLVCLGFLRFQYANITGTSLFDSTAIGWWVMLGAGGALVGQGAWERFGARVALVVPQPPPFSEKSAEEIFAAVPTDLAALPATRRLYLVQLGTNQRYELDFSRPIAIGRARDNDIVLTDDKVSRHHAIIRWQNGWMTIANQSQRAPLLLNQLPIMSENALLLGDTITLGQTHLRLIGE